ncbi:unnamed protein product [Cylicocyclus nassatus]|uniref:Granulins domain-containing protein n=1 Tax=Cylicocyclus nassatus TaxID=53992 RepID=A0AA36DSK3_CYLNA|nr:unnamed protein product [Cylicocyclus nassatus]
MSSIVIALLFSVFVAVQSRTCGSGYSCPDSATCCRLPDGKWGCCPMPEAVCCQDHVHCCPKGSECMDAMCKQKEGDDVPPQKKTKAQKTNDEGEIVCPDRRSKCPTGATCCLLTEGRYGCCPVEHANCCADHLHCCPSGYNCDASGQRCIQAEGYNVIGSYSKFHSTPIREKSGVRMGEADENEIDEQLQPIACGYRRTCPAFSTCCMVPHGKHVKHMCCPMKDGVCCEHACCPPGYHCRPHGKCEKHAAQDGIFDFFGF